MAGTAEQQAQTGVQDGSVVVVDEQDFEEARRDERVRDFHRKADEQLAQAEAAGRVLY